MLIAHRQTTIFKQIYEQNSESIQKIKFYRTNWCTKYLFINRLESLNQTGF